MIDARVLIPRPETELLVDLAIEHVRGMSRPAFIADVGTGSGNIGITLGLELPESAITAIDISEDALDVARTNAVKYRTGNVSFLCGNLLEPLPCSCDVIVANLPYVTDDEFISLPAEIVQYEPALALKGGPDGLRVIERLIIQCRNALNESGIILLEIGKGQRPMLSKMLEKYYPNCSIESFLDLNGLERVIKIKLSK
jgi:release factor glutamine methyltransferase